MTAPGLALDPASTALLVMDYQQGIVERIGTPDLLQSLTSVLDAARAAGLTVGYVRVAFTDADAAAVPVTSSFHARLSQGAGEMHADAPATAIPAEIGPEPGDIVVRKVRVGAFTTTDLDAQLRGRGVDTIVLAGLSTSGVVLSTVREAMDRDYRIVVVADLCADPDEVVHRVLIERVFARQATVVDSRGFLRLLGS